MRRMYALLIIAAVLAGCARSDAPAADLPAAGAPSVVAASMPMPAAMRGLDAADEAALAHFRLTTDNLAKATQASRNIAQLGATDPRLLKRLDQESPLSDAQTLQQAADRLAGIPQVRRAIQRAGLSPRDYILVSFTIADAAMANAYARAGRTQASPPAIAKDNLDFVAAHQPEVRQFMKAVQSMSPSDDAGSHGEP